MVGGTNGSSLARKGVCKERLLQMLSETYQVAISRRLQRYKLALSDRQAGRRRSYDAHGKKKKGKKKWKKKEEVPTTVIELANFDMKV